MSATRRHFIKLSTATAGAFAFPVKSTTLFAEQSVKPLQILILGGTGFTGPYQVRYALSRGHKVTTFNRGKTHPDELPKEVEQLIGDRNGQLDALKGRKWDVAIDNPTTLPAWVRDAAQVLKGNVERYVFISTISVYGEVKTGPDENAPTEKYEGADPYKETLEAMKASGYKTYGPLKALSEKEAEKWFPGKTLIIRPGLIVGPRDETDRFTYWPVRIDRGGEVLAPGSPDDGTIHRCPRSRRMDDPHGREPRDRNLQRNRSGETARHRWNASSDQRRPEINRDVCMDGRRFSGAAKSQGMV
jgi:2'-hydroxyisoflavone reductase